MKAIFLFVFFHFDHLLSLVKYSSTQIHPVLLGEVRFVLAILVLYLNLLFSLTLLYILVNERYYAWKFWVLFLLHLYFILKDFALGNSSQLIEGRTSIPVFIFYYLYWLIVLLWHLLNEVIQILSLRNICVWIYLGYFLMVLFVYVLHKPWS